MYFIILNLFRYSIYISFKLTIYKYINYIKLIDFKIKDSYYNYKNLKYL